MASYFTSAVQQLYNMGILDILLPFILIFTVIFAVLQRTKVLGKDENGKPMKNFNVVIALVMGAAAVMPHVLWGPPSGNRMCYLSNGLLDVVCTINNALPNISLIVIAVLMFLIIVGIWGTNIDFAGSSLGNIVTIISMIAVVLIFAIASGWMGQMPNWLWFLQDPETQAMVVVILVFGIIIRFIVGSDPDKKKNDKDKKPFIKLENSN